MWFVIAVAAALALSAALTKLEIPMLIRLKTGQNIREEGPQGHMAKAGTPSMGGLAIIAAACIVVYSIFCCISIFCFSFLIPLIIKYRLKYLYILFIIFIFIFISFF